MTAVGVFVASAALLSIERLCYVYVWRRPERFSAWCRRSMSARPVEPIDVLRRMFYGFKVIQLGVFVGWWWYFGGGVVWPSAPPPVAVAGVGLVLGGQVLSAAVFRKLGNVGVFYGNRLGHEPPWVEGFPFNVVKHPQYVGATLSVWGLFLIMRFPAPDWYVLPALETFYYILGAAYEQ